MGQGRPRVCGRADDLELLDWLGESNLASLLNKLASTDLWIATCDEIAGHLLVHAEAFTGGTSLDPTSWT